MRVDGLAISGGIDYSQTSDPSASCDTLLDGDSGSATFFWSNGNSSVFSYKQTTVDVNGEIVSTDTGTITSGEFAGNLATEVFVEPTTDLTECQSTGISSANGTVTLEVPPI